MIKYLELKNFRNHESIKILFDNKNTFIEGLNGSGKTSIIEAINYITLLKSFRTNDDKLLITNNKPYFKIILKTNKDLFEVVYHDNNKNLKINNVPISKMSEFVANLKTILFTPEDLNLIYGFPGERRLFLDTTMVQLDKEYLNTLSTYKKILKERNALLKVLKEDSDLTFLNIINQNLEKEANKIIAARTAFIKKLNKALKSHFKSFNKKDRVEVLYQPNCALNSLETVLKGRFKRDLYSETTTAGPHRDDFLIKFNNNLAKDYASQGQVRLIAISLKLALIDLHENNEEIVILLDDILSELDDLTIKELEKIFELNNQIIITGTNCNLSNIEILNLNKKEKS